jgi:hypothetical protein
MSDWTLDALPGATLTLDDSMPIGRHRDAIAADWRLCDAITDPDGPLLVDGRRHAGPPPRMQQTALGVWTIEGARGYRIAGAIGSPVEALRLAAFGDWTEMKG